MILARRASLLSLLLILVLIFPAFGGVWGEQHVVLMFFLFSLLMLFSRNLTLSLEAFLPVFFFVFLQFLLMISWWNDFKNGSAEVSDIPSALRPIALCVFYLAFSSQISNGCDFEVLKKFVLKSFLVLSVLFFINVVFKSYFISDIFYFPHDRFRDLAFISVFATTYFAAYFYYIIFLYSLCRLAFLRFSMIWASVLFCSILFLFYSQGKSGYLSAIFTSFLIAFIKFGSTLRLALCLFIIFVILIIYYNNEEVASYLQGFGHFSLYQLSIFVDKGLEFGNAALRLEQFFNSFQGSIERNFLGLGLGREVYLESYLASYTYRYGVIGFFVYNFFYLFLVLFSAAKFKKTNHAEIKLIYAFCGLWFLNIPILMLSNPMFEMGKNSIFSIFILALLFSANKLTRDPSPGRRMAGSLQFSH